MGVTNTNAYDGPFYPNGVATSFPFTFRTMSTNEVAIIDRQGEAVTGFSFSIVPSVSADGGSLVFDSAPTAAALPEFLIASAPAFGVGIDLGSVTAFNPRTLNPSFERLAVQNIFLQSSLERSLKAPFGESAGSLPPLSQRAGMLAAFSEDGGLKAVEPNWNAVDGHDDGLWNPALPITDDGAWG